tara:strand:- start:468 stop:863 length:396 start_codon:yes stop_codon:yes gene_type:complete
MFKLTKRAEYALIALRHLQMKDDMLCSSREISELYMIPKEILAKVMQKMVKLDYIDGFKGSNGGYKLKKSLKKIRLAEFIEKIEGPLGLVDCNININCAQINQCNIKMPINKINENIKIIFNKIKIADITT